MTVSLSLPTCEDRNMGVEPFCVHTRTCNLTRVSHILGVNEKLSIVKEVKDWEYVYQHVLSTEHVALVYKNTQLL